jgi:hypothetical protein
MAWIKHDDIASQGLHIDKEKKEGSSKKIMVRIFVHGGAGMS